MKRRISSGWELELLQRHIDELFDLIVSNSPSMRSAWSPPVDILELADCFVIRVDLPGVAAADVELHVHERELHLSGHKRRRPGAAQGQRCHRMERGFGSFSVEVLLPGSLRPNCGEATLRAGVLEVRLPRIADPRETTFPVVIAIEEP